MPELKVHDMAGKAVGQVTVSDKVFGAEVKDTLLTEVVRWQLAKRRAGTASTLSRSEVAGSTRKPYKQKGTGRARRGSASKSPLFPGGGVAHGPKPKDWSYRLPKKVRAAALRSALSKRVADDRVFVIDDLSLDSYRTKKVLEILSAFAVKGALLVDGSNDHLEGSSRNLPNCTYVRPEGLNVYDILRHEALVISQSAIQATEERLAL